VTGNGSSASAGASADLDVIRAIYAALDVQDVHGIVELTDPDIDIVQPGELPFSGNRHGYAGLAGFLTALAHTVNATLQTEQLFVSGSMVVQVGQARGVARCTGRRFDSPVVHVWGLRAGRVVSLHAFLDTAEVGRALAGPAPHGCQRGGD
jgi:ketosteroid isomerase-like protein